MQYWTDAFMK